MTHFHWVTQPRYKFHPPCFTEEALYVFLMRGKSFLVRLWDLNPGKVFCLTLTATSKLASNYVFSSSSSTQPVLGRGHIIYPFEQDSQLPSPSLDEYGGTGVASFVTKLCAVVVRFSNQACGDRFGTTVVCQLTYLCPIQRLMAHDSWYIHAHLHFQISVKKRVFHVPLLSVQLLFTARKRSRRRLLIQATRENVSSQSAPYLWCSLQPLTSPYTCPSYHLHRASLQRPIYIKPYCFLICTCAASIKGQMMIHSRWWRSHATVPRPCFAKDVLYVPLV